MYAWGKPVWLSGGLLELLCDLVAAAQDGTDDVAASPLVIHRLRRAIDAALGQVGAGARLIATAGDRYRLAVPRASIALEATFAELADSGLLRPEQVAGLSRRCRRLKSV